MSGGTYNLRSNDGVDEAQFAMVRRFPPVVSSVVLVGVVVSPDGDEQKILRAVNARKDAELTTVGAVVRFSPACFAAERIQTRSKGSGGSGGMGVVWLQTVSQRLFVIVWVGCGVWC